MNNNKYLIEILKNYLYNIFVIISCGVNTIIFFGDPRETICCRIGKNIVGKGFLYNLPLPEWFKRHCIHCIDNRVGEDSAFSRKDRK